MIPEGTEAPGFELPAVVDGDRCRIALDEYLGEDIVVLAFYPGDFNPAADGDSGLDALDLFTMQDDVSVLAVGPDSTYSHAAFAEAFGLHVPLLSDARFEAAGKYGVVFEDDVGEPLIERAVAVIDHEGVIQYTWHTPDAEALPDVGAVKDAIGDIGDERTAFGHYCLGHAHYTEARRSFTSAMGAYCEDEWMMAQTDFQRAREEFDEAAGHLDSAARFADDDAFRDYYAMAEERASALWQTSDWLAKSASAYSSGATGEAKGLRADATRPLKKARDFDEPVHPDELTGEDGELVDAPPGSGAAEADFEMDVEEAFEAVDDGAADEHDDGATDRPPDGTEVDDGEDAGEDVEAALEGYDPGEPESSGQDATAGADAADGEELYEGGAGDIRGEVDEDDLAALQAEMENDDERDADLANGSSDDRHSSDEADDDAAGSSDEEPD